MTIISPTPPTAPPPAAVMTAQKVVPGPTVCQVLAAAANVLEKTYPAPRLTSVDITRTVLNIADQLLPRDRSAAYRLACDALDVLAVRIGCELDRWTGTFVRTEVVAQMRAAAEQVPAVTG